MESSSWARPLSLSLQVLMHSPNSLKVKQQKLNGASLSNPAVTGMCNKYAPEFSHCAKIADIPHRTFVQQYWMQPEWMKSKRHPQEPILCKALKIRLMPETLLFDLN